MTDAVLFSEDYYRRVLAEFGYDAFELRQFDFPLAGLDAAALNTRYLCHHDGDRYLATAPQRRIVTTGFGMSGVPHLATVAQILKLIDLQRGGERCQIVLGDLDAYNGKAKPFRDVHELADRFREYVLRLGFDPRRGVVRAQVGYEPALETMYLLGRYVDQADLDQTEEDNHAYYAARGLVDPVMTFRRALSLCLMVGDFVSLGQQYDAVLVALGVDEHRYVRFAKLVRDRIDQASPLCSTFVLAATYTRMVRGFGGHPKFSKSIPGSAVDVTTPADAVRELLLGEPPVPERSATYQLMCELPHYGGETPHDLRQRCLAGGPAWRREVALLTDYVVALIELWPNP